MKDLEMANDFARVEIDETPPDIMVIDNDGTVRRPRMTVVIDSYTRMIVGVHLAIDHEDISSRERNRKTAISFAR